MKRKSTLEKLDYRIKCNKKNGIYEVKVKYKWIPIYLHLYQFLNLNRIDFISSKVSSHHDKLEHAEQALTEFCKYVREWDLEQMENCEKCKENHKGDLKEFYIIENL